MKTATADLCHTVVDTPIGPLTLVATPDALREVRFPNGRTARRRRRPGPAGPPGAGPGGAASWPSTSTDPGSTFDVPLDPRGSPFQLAAWRGLTTIPYGETVSYGEQARRLGHDGKARAIGAANGSQPAAGDRAVPPRDRQ